MSSKADATFWKVKKGPDGKVSPARGRIPEGFEVGYSQDKKTGFTLKKDLPKGHIIGSYTNGKRKKASPSQQANGVSLSPLELIKQASKGAAKRITQIESEMVALKEELQALQAIAKL